MPSSATAKNTAQLPRTPADTREVLTRRHFQLAIIWAFALHVGAVYAWYLLPKQPVLDVPVRALNIKLSDGEALTAEEIQAMQPDAGNTSQVESTISHLVRDQNAENQARDKAMINSMDKAMRGSQPSTGILNDPKQKYSSIARQFVRDINVAMKTAKAVPGNSTSKDAEIMSRYEQMISLWVEKFKVYPEEARSQGAAGATMVRIRIDRAGNIRYYALERSTGNQVLDRAAIEMVRRANPVPAVPSNYPKGELLEFLIPVNFQLK